MDITTMFYAQFRIIEMRFWKQLISNGLHVNYFLPVFQPIQTILFKTPKKLKRIACMRFFSKYWQCSVFALVKTVLSLLLVWKVKTFVLSAIMVCKIYKKVFKQILSQLQSFLLRGPRICWFNVTGSLTYKIDNFLFKINHKLQTYLKIGWKRENWTS